MLASILVHVEQSRNPPLKLVNSRFSPKSEFTVSRTKTTDLNYWIKLLSCIIEANGGHIGLSHINLHWYY